MKESKESGKDKIMGRLEEDISEMSTEERVARLEAIVLQHEKRMNALSKQLDDMRNDISHVRSSLSALKAVVEERFRGFEERFMGLESRIKSLDVRVWGILAGVILTVILAIAGLYRGISVIP